MKALKRSKQRLRTEEPEKAEREKATKKKQKKKEPKQ